MAKTLDNKEALATNTLTKIALEVNTLTKEALAT